MADRVSSKLSSGIVGRKEFCRVKGEKSLSSCSTALAWGKLYYLLSMFFCLFFVWNTKNWRLGLYDGWGKTFDLRSFHSEQEQSPLKGSATHQNQCTEIRWSGATGFRVEPFLSLPESLVKKLTFGFVWWMKEDFQLTIISLGARIISLIGFSNSSKPMHRNTVVRCNRISGRAFSVSLWVSRSPRNGNSKFCGGFLKRFLTKHCAYTFNMTNVSELVGNHLYGTKVSWTSRTVQLRSLLH